MMYTYKFLKFGIKTERRIIVFEKFIKIINS